MPEVLDRLGLGLGLAARGGGLVHVHASLDVDGTRDQDNHNQAGHGPVHAIVGSRHDAPQHTGDSDDDLIRHHAKRHAASNLQDQVVTRG